MQSLLQLYVDAAYVEAYENGNIVATYYIYGPLDGRNVL